MTAEDRRGNGEPGHGEPVLAAGCVLWRHAPGEDGDGVEICLVHRPKYDDWSHPKGKLKSGESALAGAVREVLEETGAHCEPGPELPAVRYLVEGRPKEVRYWAAETTGGAFAPNSEVDHVRWLSPAKARELLTQERDAELVTAFLDARGPAAGGG
ncbi:NUDIX hydrolase [Streptomyces amakusaensis]|uniref:NUDIX hydrolase n=1 Tax=Streptomyces amakusaensis TaxID=67271 RepID=A0ABW0AR79_9ACTN